MSLMIVHNFDGTTKLGESSKHPQLPLYNYFKVVPDLSRDTLTVLNHHLLVFEDLYHL